jgi:YlmC/YmxH family sporulation protein
MRNKDIVNINTGQNMASFKSCDLVIDESTGKIVAILLGHAKSSLFSFGTEDYDIKIPWEKIVKIGIDTIMVDH